MVNRLASAASPYLLQHADNPVDWYPWGDEAFAEAVRRDVPVLISVGYAACHWCHVMAHESFENPQIAELMNQWFVNIKVDREEHPDVDAAYIRATTMMTGHAGWPMTVFATADGRPFYCGTYFQPDVFAQLLAGVHQAWDERRDELDASVAALSEAFGKAQPMTPGLIDTSRAVRNLSAQEDRQHGGFGGAPKFPPSMVAEFLLQHAATGAETASQAGELADRLLVAMATSGMYDQLAGGFARYSVDAGWQVPHFEKMLYDNAQLASVYLHWWRLTGNPTGKRVALEICDFLVCEMRNRSGGFASALDADTDGVEGLTYVWTPDQLTQVLGEDAAWVMELTGVTEAGNFEHGSSTLRMLGEPDRRWRQARTRLLAARNRRPQPAVDDKVVLAWNGLAITALARTGALCERPDLIEIATATADHLLATHLRDDGSWVRVSRNAHPGTVPATAEDLGNLASAFLALAEVTLDRTWLDLAVGVVAALEEPRVIDQRLQGWGEAEDPSDNAYPSDGSAAATAMLSVAAATGDDALRARAVDRIAEVASLAGSAPRFAGWWLAAAEAADDGPVQITLRGCSVGDPMHLEALAATAPGRVVVSDNVVNQRDAPQAQVCRRELCELPVTTPEALRSVLAQHQAPPSQSR